MGTVTPEQMMEILPVIMNRFHVDMVTVVNNFALKYCSNITFQDGGEALSHIFDEKKVNNKILPNLNKAKKDIFYSNISTNTFHKKFDLRDIDIPLLHDILTRISCFPTCLKNITNNCPSVSQQVVATERCCGKCEHVCKSCKKANCDCQNPSWDHECKNCSATISSCLKLVCTTCEGKPLNEQCGFDRFMRALNFLKNFRHFYSHCTLEICRKFIVEQYKWKEYGNIRNWLNLSEKIMEYYTYLLNFMCNGNAFRQHLFLYQREEKLKSMKRLMEDLWFTPNLLVDNCTKFCRKKEICKKSVLHLEILCDQEYSFSLTESIHDILKVEIVTERNTLEEISDENYTFSSDETLTIIRFKDVNFVEENSFFKVRLEYEILEDCNDVIWVASSSCIERDTYRSSMIGYKDNSGNTVLTSTRGNLVRKKKIATEKLNLGICALFPKEGSDKVLAVHRKNSEDKQWDFSDYEILRETKEYFILSLTGLKRKQNYDIRILATMQSSEKLQHFVLFETFNEEALADDDLAHVAYYKKFTVFSHFYAKQYSPHSIINTESYKTLQKIEPVELLVRQGGGRIKSFTLSELEDYLTIYFKKRKVITFPPIYDTRTPLSPLKSFITLLQESFHQMKKEFCVILPNFHFYEAMGVMGIDCTQFGLNSKTFDDNGILIFDLDHHLIVSLRICNSNTIDDVRTSMELIHADTNALILLCKDFIGKEHLTIYGTIAFPKFSRAELDDPLFCTLCQKKKRFFSAEDLKDEEHLSKWWQEMLVNIKADDDDVENGETFPINREWFSTIPSQLMVVIAHERDELPILFGNDDKRIRSLLLNPDQVKAIYYPFKKKIIRGPFGSGKTIIGRAILKEVSKSCNPDNSMVYFIGMDEFSLLQVEMEGFCKEIKKDLPKNLQLECVNIREITIESGANSLLTLPECLQHLSQKNPEKTVHFVADEYDSEHLNRSQATEIKNILETSEAYRDAIVVVIAQSIEKIRSTRSKGVEINHQGHRFEETGMEVITLVETMRYSASIHNISTNAQDKVATFQNSLILPNTGEDVQKKETTFLPLGKRKYQDYKHLQSASASEQQLKDYPQPFILSQPKVETLAKYLPDNNKDDKLLQSTSASGQQMKDYPQSFFPFQPKVETLAKYLPDNNRDDKFLQSTSASGQQMKDYEQSFIPFQPKVETLAKYLPDNESNPNSEILLTSFRFFNDAVCKHGIEGKPPKLVRIDPLLDKTRAIRYFFEKIAFSGKNKGGLVLCNSLEHLEMTKETLGEIPLEFIEYAEYLRQNPPPPIARKLEVYDKWIKKPSTILLTDSSCCRGLECEKVVLIIDEREHYERHLFVEALCRSTSQLFLLSFRCPDSEEKGSKINLSEVFDLITRKELVEEISTECADLAEDSMVLEKNLPSKAVQSSALKILERFRMRIDKEEEKQKMKRNTGIEALVEAAKNFEKDERLKRFEELRTQIRMDKEEEKRKMKSNTKVLTLEQAQEIIEKAARLKRIEDLRRQIRMDKEEGKGKMKSSDSETTDEDDDINPKVSTLEQFAKTIEKDSIRNMKRKEKEARLNRVEELRRQIRIDKEEEKRKMKSSDSETIDEDVDINPKVSTLEQAAKIIEKAARLNRFEKLRREIRKDKEEEKRKMKSSDSETTDEDDDIAGERVFNQGQKRNFHSSLFS